VSKEDDVAGEIVTAYNKALTEDHRPELEWFGMSGRDEYAFRCRYVVNEGLNAVRKKGYKLTYAEPFPEVKHIEGSENEVVIHFKPVEKEVQTGK